MDFQKITDFFKWCSIINAGLLIYSILMLTLFADLAYSVHGAMFEMTRENFNIAVYWFIGLYKVLFIVFNLVPYIVLKIMARKV